MGWGTLPYPRESQLRQDIRFSAEVQEVLRCCPTLQVTKTVSSRVPAAAARRCRRWPACSGPPHLLVCIPSVQHTPRGLIHGRCACTTSQSCACEGNPTVLNELQHVLNASLPIARTLAGLGAA